MTELFEASKQWSQRPDDERFLDLPSLYESVKARREISRELEQLPLHSLKAGDDADELYVQMPSGLQLDTTHWAFGQLCRQVGAPAEYMRQLPSHVAAMNLNVGLKDLQDDTIKLLFSHNGSDVMRAINGVNYGRIWDVDVVSSLMNTLDERWSVPLQAYGGVNSKTATTLYSSDRDVFVFLTDETRPIEVDGDTLFRGFYVWNSEVGSATFGISTFLFNYVCQNRIIWGAKQVEELRIRHTSIAPSRFLEEAQPVLLAMSEASAEPVIALVQQAKATRIAKNELGAVTFLRRHGFGKAEAKRTVMTALNPDGTGSSGDPTSLWNLVQAGTAAARTIQHADQRTDQERRFSSLLRLSGKIGIEFSTNDSLDDDYEPVVA